jgi:hypothetical protein
MALLITAVALGVTGWGASRSSGTKQSTPSPLVRHSD